jgi:hypothetical protein
MPSGLGRIEGVKDAAETLRVQARARILHCDQHAVQLVFLALYQQLSPPLVDFFHGVDGEAVRKAYDDRAAWVAVPTAG